MPTFPNRCQHIKVNGTQCGCPALRRNKLCYFHKRHHDERVQFNLDRMKNDRMKNDRLKNDRLKDDRANDAHRRATIDLPVLEDANSIQVSLMQIMRLIITGQIDAKTAGLLLYALQTASANLGRTSFDPNRHYVIFDPGAVGDTALGGPVWRDSDFEDEEEEKDEEEQGKEQTGPAPNPTAAKKPIHSKTRSQWQAENEAARNATLSTTPLSAFTHGGPANPAPSDIRKQIRDQVRQAFPDLVRAVQAKAGHDG